MKKKFDPALFSPPGRWTGNHFLFKGGPSHAISTCTYLTLVDTAGTLVEVGVGRQTGQYTQHDVRVQLHVSCQL